MMEHLLPSCLAKISEQKGYIMPSGETIEPPTKEVSKANKM